MIAMAVLAMAVLAVAKIAKLQGDEETAKTLLLRGL
jgi:Tfp pilus assembly protein PilV